MKHLIAELSSTISLDVTRNVTLLSVRSRNYCRTSDSTCPQPKRLNPRGLHFSILQFFTSQHDPQAQTLNFDHRNGCIFRVIPTAMLHNLPTQHYLFVSYNWDGVCLLRGTDTFFTGVTDPTGPGPAQCRDFTITLRHTTLDTHAPGGIRTCSPQQASGPDLGYENNI
jgi:hypothetical protein